MYIGKTNHIVNKFNNTYHKTIELKPTDVKSSTYFDFGVKNNGKEIKYKVGDHLGIPKYKNIYAKGYTLNCPMFLSLIL